MSGESGLSAETTGGMAAHPTRYGMTQTSGSAAFGRRGSHAQDGLFVSWTVDRPSRIIGDTGVDGAGKTIR